MNQAAALLTILTASLIFIGANVLVSPWVNPNLIFLFDIVLWTVGNILLTEAIRRREKRLGLKLYD